MHLGIPSAGDVHPGIAQLAVEAFEAARARDADVRLVVARLGQAGQREHLDVRVDTADLEALGEVFAFTGGERDERERASAASERVLERHSVHSGKS